ncbi:MAG: hypothetical protein R3B68_04710 [Phycisphaerales bacterium]
MQQPAGGQSGPEDADDHDGDAAHAPGTTAPTRAPELALELTGALPCVRCTYNLRGLSISGKCPECGTAIRATILARVDPLAKELQPLYTPKVTAGCLILWTIGALAAAVASWVPRAIEALERVGPSVSTPGWIAPAILAGITISALAALALIRPHGRIPAWQSWAAAAACLLYIPLLLTIRHIHTAIDARDPSPYLDVGGIDPTRATWRLLAEALLVAILLLLRPNARVLAARSMVMRTGQVDRQTMLAMAAAIGVGAVGDVLAIFALPADGALSDALRIAATLFIGVGSLLVTLGLGSMVLDTIRLAPVVASPPLALSDVAAPTTRTNPTS